MYDKYTLQSVFPKEYRLKDRYVLPRDAFMVEEKEFHIPCTFYVWDKSDGEDLRFNVDLYKTEDFQFINKTQATEVDFFILGASPNVIKEISEVTTTNRGYYVRPKLKTKEYLIKRFKETKFEALSCVNGGVSWRTKPEIVCSYLKGENK